MNVARGGELIQRPKKICFADQAAVSCSFPTNQVHVHRDVVQVEGRDLAVLTGNGAALVAHANRPHAGPATLVTYSLSIESAKRFLPGSLEVSRKANGLSQFNLLETELVPCGLPFMPGISNGFGIPAESLFFVASFKMGIREHE